MKHEHNMNNRRYLISTIMNIIITVAELMGGLISGSLALVSDAIHNLTDVVSLVIAWVAQLISGRGMNAKNTFGYRRAQIIAAFVNSTFMIMVSLFLIFESVKGFFNPHPIQGNLMLIISVIGLIANVITGMVLARGEGNLNQRAALLHVIGDALSSVGVIFAAVMITWANWLWLDPLITLVVAIYIMHETWSVLKEATNILMESNPNVDLNDVRKLILECPYVKGAHHFHIWQIDEDQTLLTFHVTMENQPLIQVEQSIHEIQQVILENYQIDHVTVQPEVDHLNDQIVDLNECQSEN
ncbi:CDF family cation diffusion facilitator [Weissella koreensis KACC 15510]|uniref:cation diffusion facilitator family transporter n=1 Tax=Weissella koreensis TaxID=165096 RepID=UPI0002174AEE|nr:cation diffusion facilitator family transporter [Weissella koreensis]AEJ23236.1 CDF family cation diffusion facilitator [Weissella koreensis KACC 15510]